mgnify:FL=1
MVIEFIFGLLGIAVSIYIFKLADGADENEMFLIDTCLISGTLILITALIPTIMGLIDIIQYFIY